MHFTILGVFLPPKCTHICDNMYRGFFDTDTGVGEMKDDEFGRSGIGKIILTRDAFEFSQFYDEGGLPELRYSFKKEGGIWVGVRTGKGIDNQMTKCVVNEVPLRFLTC